MKTKEELNALKLEVEALNAKLAELTEEETMHVTGGSQEIADILIDGLLDDEGMNDVTGGSGTSPKSHRELEEEEESLIANKL